MEFLAMLRRLHAANKPVPLVTLPFITDGRKAFTVAQIREASPRTKIVARIFTGRDYHAEDVGGWNFATRQDGRDYFERNRVLISADIANADFVQIRDLNEPGEGIGINAWHQGILDGADAMGIKLAILHFSVGNPADLGFWRWASTIELLRRVKRDGHALALHQYAWNNSWTDESFMLRHLRIMPLLPGDLQDIPLYFTEFGESYYAPGTPAGRDPARYEPLLKGAQRDLAKAYNVIGAALWTLGDSGGWGPDRLEGVMALYERLAMEL